MASARALRFLGPLAVVVVGALAALALVSGGRVSGTPVASSNGPTYARSLDGRITVLRQDRLAQAAIDWRGGPITTSTGETVTVHVSSSFGPEVTPEGWAEFLTKLVHGPELALLTTYIAPLSEIQQLCGARALGCYSRDTAVSIGETLTDGSTAEEVVRHEYGHHIALHRVNTPWRAIDWGPKRWASAANVCAKVSRSQAFPGDQGENYAQNPGEAWAEVYRLMDERRAGILTARWPIVARSFYPDEATLKAAERDVLEPWTAGQKSVFRRKLQKQGQTWWIPLSTPLDGSYAITMTLPRGGLHEAALVAANRRTVVKRAVSTGQRVKRMTGNVCGQRSLYVRVQQKGTLGQVTVTASKS